MSVGVRQVSNWLEQLAPPRLAEEWDNVGLQIGSTEASVSQIMTCLSLSDAVLQQAIAAGVQMIVAHHPLIFRPLSSILESNVVERRVAQIIKHNIALYVAHTNLDAAPLGVGQWLDEMFGLHQATPLVPSPNDKYVKLVVYVPITHLDVVRDALTTAGAGHIGNYAACTFATPGTGTFRPQVGAQPFVGDVGQITQVAESRLETVVPEYLLQSVLAQMHQVHPYEEVAYDVYQLVISPRCGFGRVGHLEQAMPFAEFITFAQSQIQVSELRVVGPPPQSIRRVAVLNGSGASYIADAHRAHVDIYITGDVRYHDAEMAETLGLCVVDAGHFATEKFIPKRVATYLREAIATNNLHCQVLEAAETELFTVLSD